MQDKQYNNADSFAIAFDEQWEVIDCLDNNLKIKKIINILSDHPFVQSKPEIAIEIAKFRINSLGKFK